MAGLISGGTIASLVAMLAGTAMQHKATSDANKRMTAQTQASIQRQQDLQRQAEQKALGEAAKYAAPERADDQQAIEQELTQEFIAPVENAAEMNASATTTQGNVSGDYANAKAKSDLNVMKSARTLAGLLGKTTGAGRLRQNEAIRFADTAGGIDRLANFSRGQAGADEIGIRAAGVPDAGMTALGGIMQGVGSLGVSGAFNGATSAAGGSGITGTASTAGIGAPIATAGGGLGMRAVGGTGFKTGGYAIPNLLRG